MINRLRQRLLLLLMVCLPLQGWAAATMAVSMAGSMAGSMALPAQAHHQAQAGAATVHPLAPSAAVQHGHEGDKFHVGHQVHHGHHGHQAHDQHGGDHHAHGMMGACCAEPNDAADSAGGTHGPCGDRCHCCVSAAPPSASAVLGVHAAPTDWGGTAPSGRPQAVAFALDKPPKA